MCPATRRAPILGDWGRGGGCSQPWVLSPVGAGWGQKGHKRAWPPLETAPGEGGSLLPKPQPQVSPCALCTPGVAICPAVGPCPSLTPVRPWPRLGCVLPRLRLGPASKGAPLCPARPHLPAPCSLPSVPSQARVSRVRPQAFSGTGISDLLRGPSFPFLTNPVSCVYPAALRRKLPQAVGGRVPAGSGATVERAHFLGGHRGSRGGAGGTGGTRSHRQARSLQQGDADRAGQRADRRRGDPRQAGVAGEGQRPCRSRQGGGQALARGRGPRQHAEQVGGQPSARAPASVGAVLLGVPGRRPSLHIRDSALSYS